MGHQLERQIGLPNLIRDLLKLAGLGLASIVDQDIDLAEMSARIFVKGLALGGVGDVSRKGLGHIPIAGVDLRLCLGQSCSVAGSNGNLGSGFRKLLRHRKAEPFAAAGD